MSTHNMFLWRTKGMVGCGKGVYLTSPGHPIEIGLQLGKACYPCSRYRGGMLWTVTS